MTQIGDDLGRLDVLLSELEVSIQGAQAMTGAFRNEMEDASAAMRVAGQDASGLSRSLGTNLKSAFQGLIFDGARLSDVMSRVGLSLSRTVLNAALKPITDTVGGLLGGVAGGVFEKGGAFSSGRVTPFARGGIVDRATTFPMRGGVGLMGEAGPEAIMPLSRGPDGRLGVQAAGGGRAVHVTMNVTTPDVAGFARSRTQIAAQMSRALSRGRRNG